MTGSLPRFALRPTQAKEMAVIGGATATIYEATTEDPHCRLTPYGWRKLSELPPGRYAVLAAIVAEGGAVSAPVLYVNRGQGYQDAPEARIPLRLVMPDVYWAEFELSGTLAGLRLDPSVRKETFALGPIWMQGAAGQGDQGVSHGLYRLTCKILDAVLPVGLARSIRKLRLLSLLSPLHLTAEAFADDVASQDDREATSRALSIFRRGLPRDPDDLRPDNPWFAAARDGRGKQYGAPAPTACDADRCVVRPIAIYRPQVHAATRDARTNLSDWVKVIRAVPQFEGHYQPRVPIGPGYYDLRAPETLRQQIQLARHYGLHGFCFQYVWPRGSHVVSPLDGFLADASLDFGFCLSWIGGLEQWRGDAGDRGLAGQQLMHDDEAALLRGLARYLADPRYIRVNGRPLLIIDRPGLLASTAEAAARWRAEALRLGHPGLFLVAAGAAGVAHPLEIGFDAILESPPRDSGSVTRYADVARNSAARYVAGATVIPAAMTSWDTEARRPGHGTVVHGSTPQAFREWLEACFAQATRNAERGCPFVFINAWNDWTNAAYLEPDQAFGHAYIAAVASALQDHARPDAATEALVAAHNDQWRRRASRVCVAHLYYFDLVDDILSACLRIPDLDLYLTVPRSWSTAQLRVVLAKVPNARIFLCANRGRDIWPFIVALSHAIAVDYAFVCKVHTKKSAHLGSGGMWRRSLVRDLLDPANVAAVTGMFVASPSVGLIAPGPALLPVNDAARLSNNRSRIEEFLRRWGRGGELDALFPAGSMFWARTGALRPLLDLGLSEQDFEYELGQIDGTTAHAIERCFGICAAIGGYETAALPSEAGFNPYAPGGIAS